MAKKPDLSKLPKYITIIAKEISETAVGSVKLEDVSIAHQEQFDKLLAADEDPCQVIVRVPAAVGQKGAGAYYGPRIIKQMGEDILAQIVPGYEGHTPECDRQYVKRPIATYWIGSLYNEEEEALYVRGLVAKSADQLKLEIRAGVINQVSLYGPVQYEWTYKEDGTGYLNVIDFKFESLDWTPPNMAGMPTSVVTKEMEGQDMDLKALVKLAMEKGYTVEQLVAEMDSKKTVIASEMVKKLATHTKIAAEINQIADKELTDDELVQWVLDLVAKANVSAADAITTLVKEAVSAVVTDVAAQQDVTSVVAEMLGNTKGKTKEQIASEVSAILAKPAIARMINASGTNGNYSRHTPAGDHKDPVGVTRTTKRV